MRAIPLDVIRSRIKFFLGEDIQDDIIHKHEMSKLVMADLEDIIYSAIARVVNDIFQK